MAKTSSKPEIRPATITALPNGGAVLFVFVPPVPASRPRVSKWGTYYGKTYKDYMAQSEQAIPPANVTMDGPLRVKVRFVCPRPKTTKRGSPRGDIDNHLKAILDVLTKKGYWHDDDQIVRVVATKRFTEESDEPPHTWIKIESDL